MNLNKPAGLTSHDCVAKVRKLLHMKRVGHAGTLDPAAVGVLPIALGTTTRLLQFLQPGKAYRATLRLGQRTTTDDLEGETCFLEPAAHLDLNQVTTALEGFVGKIQQIPPAYSAIQVEGKRLYQRAMAGEVLEVPPRTVEIFRIEILDWRPGKFPELEVAIACGSGTYIRAIARDLGLALATGGTLVHLIRTESSGFPLAESLTLEALAIQVQQGEFYPLSPESALGHLPRLQLADDLAQRWCYGQRLTWNPADTGGEGTDYWRIYDLAGHFLGVGQQGNVAGEQQLLPKVVLHP
ncbi:tRNA pseudouridine(55) synthase TruB [Neosynechococcus sphagnicola]|uniref:tRNA pseudouridine(55) synthase TruB n=1 Tax=Neosynechococcus sphagnicola TaxID=1501145 RepID=UPI001EF9E2CC|nr:tRNA pseudouridine(55) synthase TruB [Neosynechococcus sphagnicola]